MSYYREKKGKKEKEYDPFKVNIIKLEDFLSLGKALEKLSLKTGRNIGEEDLDEIDNLPNIDNCEEEIKEIHELMNKMFPGSDITNVQPQEIKSDKLNLMKCINKVSDDEQERAICYLIDNVPKKHLDKVWAEIQNEGADWWMKYHLSFGIYIRNILRDGGFNWTDILLDDLWYKLIEEAARRVMQ